MTDIVAAASTSELSEWVWREKYRYGNEKTIGETHRRVVRGVYRNDLDHSAEAVALMDNLIWCPAGRINAGAGTNKNVTQINCFVSPIIQDSLSRPIEGKPGLPIMKVLDVAAVTQQMGGGIGMDFSPLRPDGAVVKWTGSVSTGPLPFMIMWDAMCVTIKSSGSRRGAMMGVLHCTHPDIFKLINAKHEKDVLTNFNVSILITDAFMAAVRQDELWDLGFHIPRADGNHVAVYDKDGLPWYVYQRVSAREMWNTIRRSTFEYAEPGVIFIDRVNQWNNLWYCEEITCCNPCGEQVLPPDGDCNLGAVNLAKLVDLPFTTKYSFDYGLLKTAVRVGVRFLDNVIDTALFPTPEQKAEAEAKRRIGLGITGLGNALQMMMLRYGSPSSIRRIEDIWGCIRDTAYEASIELAKERGPFPAFDRNKYCEGLFIKTLPAHIQEGIKKYGIRNSVLLNIAPTGTTSMYYENVSSGLEPTIAWTFKRKALEHDNTYREFKEVSDYGFEMFKKTHPTWKTGDPLPDYMCSALQAPNIVTVEEHLAVQAACQKYIDASISKTINCPADITFEAFGDVYDRAFDLGFKGCTTYKPSAVRGSVISVAEEPGQAKSQISFPITPRPEELEGTTYKIKYPGIDQAFYVVINDFINEEGNRRPFEMFINTKSVTHYEWIAALTRMVSAIFRRGGDVTFVVDELKQVFSGKGGVFWKGKFTPSLVAAIGHVIEKHFIKLGMIDDGGLEISKEVSSSLIVDDSTSTPLGETCPQCQAPTLFKEEGCGKCRSCGFSECN